jgi:hypothetical protein
VLQEWNEQEEEQHSIAARISSIRTNDSDSLILLHYEQTEQRGDSFSIDYFAVSPTDLYSTHVIITNLLTAQEAVAPIIGLHENQQVRSILNYITTASMSTTPVKSIRETRNRTPSLKVQEESERVIASQRNKEQAQVLREQRSQQRESQSADLSIASEALMETSASQLRKQQREQSQKEKIHQRNLKRSQAERAKDHIQAKRDQARQTKEQIRHQRAIERKELALMRSEDLFSQRIRKQLRKQAQSQSQLRPKPRSRFTAEDFQRTTSSSSQAFGPERLSNHRNFETDEETSQDREIREQG